ncbi:hypothetical protein SKAU_G00161940 [Synaphobranchus kaupii]|uniref:Uncharacterized protein n=1 Tax=Synaphobranchus kaupii TaxID=118154 RepID=A0A9Q1IXR4_SYNKA|nr:hypothetical protein SKAU_G00161940 [Synaphobranchus kaupii]
MPLVERRDHGGSRLRGRGAVAVQFHDAGTGFDRVPSGTTGSDLAAWYHCTEYTLCTSRVHQSLIQTTAWDIIPPYQNPPTASSPPGDGDRSTLEASEASLLSPHRGGALRKRPSFHHPVRPCSWNPSVFQARACSSGVGPRRIHVPGHREGHGRCGSREACWRNQRTQTTSALRVLLSIS